MSYLFSSISDLSRAHTGCPAAAFPAAALPDFSVKIRSVDNVVKSLIRRVQFCRLQIGLSDLLSIKYQLLNIGA